MNPKTIIFIGRSGCGKGTQSKLMQDYLKRTAPEYKVFYLETGDRFRQFIATDNYSSRLSQEIMHNSELQPAFLAIHVWSHEFIENLKGDEHMILDGTPRSHSEVQALDTAFRFYKRVEPIVFVIDVSNDWAKNRMKERGRVDTDKAGDTEKRLTWFDTDVVPTIRHMEDSKLYKVVKINGEQSIEKVHADIVEFLEVSK